MPRHTLLTEASQGEGLMGALATMCAMVPKRKSSNPDSLRECCGLEDSNEALDYLFSGGAGKFSTKWDYKILLNVLAQLRAASEKKNDDELTELLGKVRIGVPTKSMVEGSPGAYAFSLDPAAQTSWVLVEARWMEQIDFFAKFGVLSALPAYGDMFISFVRQTASEFFGRFLTAYREATCTGQPPPVYDFRFEDFISRSQHEVSFLLFDQLEGMIVFNTLAWTVLHEVGHHILKHTVTAPNSLQDHRQCELAADKWAFSRMKDLGYSLFGVRCYIDARANTEIIFGALGLIGDEKDSTHPTWENRKRQLHANFDVFAGSGQWPLLYYIPVQNSGKSVMVTLVIDDPNSPNSICAVICFSGDILFGAAEWNGKKVTIYIRDANGRVEFIIEDVTFVAPLIELRMYDDKNLLVHSGRCFPAIQMDAQDYRAIEINGVKMSEFVKPIGRSMMTDHLRKLGVSESATRQTFSEIDKYNELHWRTALDYMKGNISFETMAKQWQEQGHAYEQHLIGLLGENRYRAFNELYTNELSRIMPPMKGAGAWEERILHDFFGE